MPADKETQNNLTAADHVKAMTGSDGWKIVEGKLTQRIMDLQNIANLDMNKPETLSTQLAARTMAVQEIYAWLKSDVYGFIEQQESNNQKLVDKPEGFIDRDL